VRDRYFRSIGFPRVRCGAARLLFLLFFLSFFLFSLLRSAPPAPRRPPFPVSDSDRSRRESIAILVRTLAPSSIIGSSKDTELPSLDTIMDPTEHSPSVHRCCLVVEVARDLEKFRLRGEHLSSSWQVLRRASGEKIYAFVTRTGITHYFTRWDGRTKTTFIRLDHRREELAIVRNEKRRRKGVYFRG